MHGRTSIPTFGRVWAVMSKWEMCGDRSRAIDVGLGDADVR